MAASLMGIQMKYCGSFALMLLCAAPFAVWGQVLSDPTRPPPGINDVAPASGVAESAPARGLQSVIISPTHCAAIIDGKTVELGAKHGHEKLIEVSERGVVLQGEHGRRVLTLFPAVAIKVTEVVPLDRQAVECKFEQIKHANNPAKQAGQKEKK
jgi:hypothetical protein